MISNKFRYIAKPFVKWAGGKSQLLDEIDKRLPINVTSGEKVTYVEPFVGGGAALFYLLTKYPNIRHAVINDINSRLMTTYRVIKEQPHDLISRLRILQEAYWPKNHEERTEMFLEQRKRYNTEGLSELETAALFIFLNRTCFNGLYRENSKGGFNVPHGRYSNPQICDEKTILADSGLLQKVTILCGDFSGTLKFAGRESFFYFDPPYKPLSETSSFNTYVKEPFDDAEQVRLKEFVKQVAERGSQFILSNSDVKGKNPEDNFFDDLYKDFTIYRVLAYRTVNANPEKRGKLTELMITNIHPYYRMEDLPIMMVSDYETEYQTNRKENIMNDDELKIFMSRLAEINFSANSTIEDARNVISQINEFLYTNYEGLGETEALGSVYPYLSEFHKYWERNHREILDCQIDEDKCKEVAVALHQVFLLTNGSAFSEVYDTCGLTKKQICRVRFLTANQDFRGSRSFSDFAQKFLDDSSIFDVESMFNDPETFVHDIGITGLSQDDKRVSYVKNISMFLRQRNITEPYNIISYYDNDISQLREAMISCAGAGYGNKKTDMFLRDMVVLNVWENVRNFDVIDVASDINTIKVALRTGIIKTAIPLLSSFMDIFCHQYSYIDEMNALAWRRVWEIWTELYPNESIASPCLMDYFIYNVVGKQFCKEILVKFQCDTYPEHRFDWHSGRNRTCQICVSEHRGRNSAHPVVKVMPCSDSNGEVAIVRTEFVRSLPDDKKITTCPFKNICTGNKSLQPPKSISILGQTGWTSAYTRKGDGGGGLMA